MQKKSLLNCWTMVEQLINISVPFLTHCATLPFSSRFFDFFLALALITVSLALSLKLSFWTKFLREFRRSCAKKTQNALIVIQLFQVILSYHRAYLDEEGDDKAQSRPNSRDET